MKRTTFLASFLLTSAPLVSAAVGDKVDTSFYVVDGIVMHKQLDNSLVVNRVESTRFYDSTKGNTWCSNSDDLFCWSHSASNSIQYWQSYYGVFAKPQSGSYYDTDENKIQYNATSMPLPYGRIGTESTRTPKADGSYSDTFVDIPDPNCLEVARDMYHSIVPDTKSGSFKAAAEWFFTSQSDLTANNGTFIFNAPYAPSAGYVNCGGYYKNYFGGPLDTDKYSVEEIAKQSLSYTTVYSKSIDDLGSNNNSTNNSPFEDGNIGAVKNLLLAGFGISEGKQTQAGNIPVIGLWNKDGTGHFITCYGFTTNEEGELESIFIADSDDDQGPDAISNITQYYISQTVDKIEKDGETVEIKRIALYKDNTCQTREGTYYIGEISYINTPQVLQDMLAEYSDTANEAQVWNGESNVWTAQTATTEELPTADTGWDINVNGDNIDEEHQGYYHTYSTDGRAVVFGTEGAANKSITINGTVKTSHITVSADGYEFKAGTDAAAIAGATEGENASLSITGGASLNSAVALNLKNLTMESGASLSSSQTVVVTGAFLVKLQAANTYSLRNAAAPSASVDSDLDLSDATSITLEAAVNMNEHTLRLPDITGGNKPALTFTLAEDSANAAFYNFSRLYFGDSETAAESFTMQATEVFSNSDTTDLTNYFVVYDAKLHTLSLVHANLVPEPATATLSLLALAALAARRRRR